MIEKHIVRRSPDTLQLQDDYLRDFHPLLKRIYAQRSIHDASELDCGLKTLALPSQFKDMDKAVQRLQRAVMQGEKIIIVADFDADGATSCALAVLALEAMGAKGVGFVVPNRFEYGYGLSREIVAEVARQNPDVIITVDNGISSIEGVAAANDAGIDVVVTDHHLAAAQLPAAYAIVNPNQPGCEFPSKCIAGVGVIFYVMSALRGALRDSGWFSASGNAEPNMAQFLDLVALGTVADVVPLDRNNRVFVQQGLKRIRSGNARPGILALLEVAQRRRERTIAADFGFAVAPRLNAAGRLDDMTHGIACLLCESYEIARDMAEELDALNRDRRSIETTMQQEAMTAISSLHLNDKHPQIPNSFCLFDENWHQGVVGLVASRIKEKFHRPVIAFANAEQAGELKGSARSIPGLHIRDVLDALATRHPGLLEKFGGHAMAAGLSLKAANLEQFRQAFEEEVTAQVNEEILLPVIYSDGELASDDLHMYSAQVIRDAGPWGQQFPEPIFDGVFFLVQQKLVGEKHLKMVLAPEHDSQHLLDAIAFNIDTKLWPNTQVERVKLAYRLDINEFRGQQSLQLMVDHIQAA